MMFEGTMDFSHRYYKINKMLLKYLGSWPYQTNRGRASLIASGVLVASVELVFQTVLSAIYADIKSVVDVATVFLYIFSCWIRQMCFIWNSHKMLKLLNRIRNDWQVWAQDQEVHILHHYANQGRKMTIAYTVLLHLVFVLFVCEPFAHKIIDVVLKNGSNPWEFVIPLDGPIDYHTYYFLITTYTWMLGFVTMFIMSAGDTMFMVYAQHGCALFAALGHKLERIRENRSAAATSKTAYSLDKGDLDFEYLGLCIDRHNEAIEYGELIEATYSWTLFLDMGITTMAISATGFQIVKKTGGLRDTIKTVSWLVALLNHIFLASYMSQMLIDHSTRIRRYIHNSKWYNLSPKARKLLPLMLLRCGVPCNLSAGKIAVMCMETCAGLLKASISYFTLLRTM